MGDEVTKTCPTCKIEFVTAKRGRGRGKTPTYCARACRPSFDAREKVSRRNNPATSDREYTEEELAFLKACEQYKKSKRVAFLTACETLAVAVGMGYRKVAGAEVG